MNLIATINVVTFFLYLTSAIIIFKSMILKKVYRAEGIFLFMLASIPCFVCISNILEHGFSIDYFDDYEGFFRDLYAMFFLIFLYVLSLRKEQKKRLEHEHQIKMDLILKSKLLNEIHHRVNNNLQIVSGLLTMQIFHEDDERVIDFVQLVQNRIQTIATVHKIIYAAPNLMQVDINKIFKSILTNLKANYLKNQTSIQLIENIEDNVELDLDRAMPMSLILNELVSNALRHAFQKNGAGQIIVSIYSSETEFTFIVNDDGQGYNVCEKEKENKGMGLVLVKNLVNQLRGKMVVEAEFGTKVKIVFPKYNPSPLEF
ncbi:sensor histidine kinase [Leptospira sp. 96542]|nr:sensor histidine kinase [Leptospira sp. 96542]